MGQAAGRGGQKGGFRAGGEELQAAGVSAWGRCAACQGVGGRGSQLGLPGALRRRLTWRPHGRGCWGVGVEARGSGLYVS